MLSDSDQSVFSDWLIVLSSQLTNPNRVLNAAKPGHSADPVSAVTKLIYRVSHSKVNKVILFWWGYRFWLLLIFWILHFYEIWPFMFQSSVFIELIFFTIYGPKCRHANKIFGKKRLNVPFVKLFSKFFFWTFFEFFDAFLFWVFS